MSATGGERWTLPQSDLLKATYLVTYDEEMRPNWDRVEERYNLAALHYGFPKRTNIGLRKRWSRLQANYLQHDLNRVANYTSLVRQLINGQTLSSPTTNLPIQDLAEGHPEVDIEESLEATDNEYTYGSSLFSALPHASLGQRHEPQQSPGQGSSRENAQEQKTTWPSQLLQGFHE